MLVEIYIITIVLFIISLILVTIINFNTEKDRQEPPMPFFKLPIIGHLHLLAGYTVPYQAFTNLGMKFGNVVKLQLGNVKCVVVNGQEHIREALISKGHHFDSRPDFQRYQQLFSGNKENSLAFCDWSTTQKTRRDMLKAYTFPKAFSNKFHSLETLILNATQTLIDQIDDDIDRPVEIKPKIMNVCANVFTKHFCTRSFNENDSDFLEMIDNYDDIFYEVNQGYAADFLPFLMPFYRSHLKRINACTENIRKFVLTRIIADRFEKFDLHGNCDENDYVDSLIKYVKSDFNSDLSWNEALFALEDIIGGHSAVGNFIVKIFAFLAKEPQVQQRIQQEIDTNLGRTPIRISDRNSLPYTEATIFEAIRLIASPIVPRVANRDSQINGYKIEKGSVLFLNNYDLSMSEQLWHQPGKFQPERFVKHNRLIKPEHFLPFGGGRRSCMGYKMVQLVSFGILGGILQNFTLIPIETNYNVPIGSLALPKNTFKFKFIKR